MTLALVHWGSALSIFWTTERLRQYSHSRPFFYSIRNPRECQMFKMTYSIIVRCQAVHLCSRASGWHAKLASSLRAESTSWPWYASSLCIVLHQMDALHVLLQRHWGGYLLLLTLRSPCRTPTECRYASPPTMSMRVAWMARCIIQDIINTMRDLAYISGY